MRITKIDSVMSSYIWGSILNASHKRDSSKRKSTVLHCSEVNWLLTKIFDSSKWSPYKQSSIVYEFNDVSIIHHSKYIILF